MGTQCAGCERSAEIPDLLEDLKIDLKLDLGGKLETLGKQIEEKFMPQAHTSLTSESLEETAKNLNVLATGLEAKINKVTNSTEQLANTATTYRDALLNKNQSGRAQGGQRNPDPALNAATSRKARQVLIQITEAEVATHSQEVLMEKAMTAIGQITHPPPPEGLTIIEVTKLRKGAILLLFNSKEAADWIQGEDAELEFTIGFLSGAKIKPRQYAILAPRTPLTLDPNNEEHLREIEEANGLAINAIAKAKWIKPANRRKAGQLVAHATLTLNSAKEANKCIRDGLLICGARIFPTKLKQEPTQCMKCRRWGHFATECQDTKDTCGTCGGEHRTNACAESNIRYCVSCNVASHASWDRNCPEFRKRCSWHDNKHPENLLKFFPTEDAWTQVERPERIPITERFPARFAVGSLPPPNRAEREPTARQSETRQREPRRNQVRQGSQQQQQQTRRRTPSQRVTGVPEREEGEIRNNLYASGGRGPNYPSWEDASSTEDPLADWN
jgi:hypothetical protein